MVGDLLPDWLAGDERAPEVAAGELPEPIEVLARERPIQALLAAHPLSGLDVEPLLADPRRGDTGAEVARQGVREREAQSWLLPSVPWRHRRLAKLHRRMWNAAAGTSPKWGMWP